MATIMAVVLDVDKKFDTTRDGRKELLILSGDLKFQVSPKVLILCHQRTLHG